MLPLLYSCKWSEPDDILKSSRVYGTTIDDDEKRTTYTSTSMLCARTIDTIISNQFCFFLLFRVRVKLFNVVYIEWIAIKHWMRECIIDYHGNIFLMNSERKTKRLDVASTSQNWKKNLYKKLHQIQWNTLLKKATFVCLVFWNTQLILSINQYFMMIDMIDYYM
jgi:hypothetical protein